MRGGDYLVPAWRNSNTRPESTAARMRANVSATVRNFRSVRSTSRNLYMLDFRTCCVDMIYYHLYGIYQSGHR